MDHHKRNLRHLYLILGLMGWLVAHGSHAWAKTTHQCLFHVKVKHATHITALKTKKGPYAIEARFYVVKVLGAQRGFRTFCERYHRHSFTHRFSMPTRTLAQQFKPGFQMRIRYRVHQRLLRTAPRSSKKRKVPHR